jgi:hypothetical protein
MKHKTASGLQMTTWWIGALLGLLFGLLPPFNSTSAAAQEPVETESLVIVVRDSAGHPLAGVGIELYLAGPPHELYKQALTEADGAARFLVFPAEYVVTFVEDWDELPFVSPSQQNGGAQTHGDVGGYGVHVGRRADSSDHLVTFVLARNGEGLLVPLFDMSRDPALPPEPFLAQGRIDEEVRVTVDPALDLAPLIEPDEAQPTIVADVVRPLEPGLVQDQAPIAEEQDVSPIASDRRRRPFLVVVAISALAAALLSLTWMLRQGRSTTPKRR